MEKTPTIRKMTVRLPEDLAQALDEIARRNRRSLHAEILVSIEERIADKRATNEKEEK